MTFAKALRDAGNRATESCYITKHVWFPLLSITSLPIQNVTRDVSTNLVLVMLSSFSIWPNMYLLKRPCPVAGGAPLV